MTNKSIAKVFLLSTVLALSGCSVYKAASNEGVRLYEVAKCKNKGCFLSLGMDVVDRHQNENGTYTETYRAIASKNGSNYVRALGHGVLDVATIGLWEVAGTPVEGAISNNRGFITAVATYANKEAFEVSNVEIYDARGTKAVSKK